MDEIESPKVRPQDLLREVEAVLLRRVEHIERENQRLRRFMMMLAAGLAIVLALSAAMLVFSIAGFPGGVAEVVEAERFVLRDQSGLARGSLELTEEGGTELVLRDRDARERVRLALLPNGSPGLTFADREGRARAVLGLLPDETSTLVFADHRGRSRAVLGLSPDESSTLVFADRFGATRVGVGVDPEGQPGITIFEKDQPSATGALRSPDSTATPDSLPIP